jgi:hypothetical protein
MVYKILLMIALMAPILLVAIGTMMHGSPAPRADER